ncbi:MAG: TaqI-like C-terminal specificity domain-containing protein [Myxococcota bacterium]
MHDALASYLHSRARGASHRGAVRAASEAVATDPWRVVQEGGALARARPVVAETDLGLTADLDPVALTDMRAVVRIGQGQPYPQRDPRQRRRAGAYDTPAELARTVVQATLAAAKRCRRALDPACGSGAFLVALTEAGVADVTGTDLDEVVLEVARVACPQAHLDVADALEPGPPADVVCGNPPFIRTERQDRNLRRRLRERLPWLRGRFDLVVPFAAIASERVASGGALGLVLPYSCFVQPYATPLRRRWLHGFGVARLEGPMAFPGAAVQVGWLVLEPGCRHTSAWPAEAALRLPAVPFTPSLHRRDVSIVERMAACSDVLGTFCEVDTGLVAHGAHGGKARLLCETPTSGTVPYADARGFFAGRHGWLHYRPHEMHRPKRPALFESPKIVIQRLRGRAPVRAAVDRKGIYVGHTCTVVRPLDPSTDLERLLELIRSPLVDGYTRIRCGVRLDLYPRDVRSMPVPHGWLERPGQGLAEAFGLGPSEVERLYVAAGR